MINPQDLRNLWEEAMKFQVDEKFIIDCFKDIVAVPSPVGYFTQLNPVLERYAAMFGQTVTYDNRSTAYITLDGEDNSRTVLLGAHADTLGLMVRKIENDGRIRVRALGGINYCNVEGESVTVYTRDGRPYTGMMICQSHSVHAFLDARTLPRNEDTMLILLDEKVSSKEDVLALGIRNGDFVHIDPYCEFTENGFLKSRFIDDKAAIACTFAMLKYLTENNLKPKYRTILAFPYQEEIGIGGRYVPEEVSEYVAVDIGIIGPDYEGNEYSVSICAKDKNGPYNFDLTSHLVNLAEKAECDYVVDVFLNYSTDANAALRAGNNIRQAAFGMACSCSHGRERTHISGLTNTTNLMLAYVLDI